MKTDDKIQRWYSIEKELANKLSNSTRDERKLLYKTVYNELFQRVPWHPMLIKKEDEGSKRLRIQQQLRIVDNKINSDTVFMEIGAGDCCFALELTQRVKQVYAVDVSDEIVRTDISLPNNFKLIISDGISIEVPDNSVDVAYSNQLIEHLHTDDIDVHFQNVRDVLRAGGIYIILTPHRFKGPLDISKYFDRVATGFHLREYTFSELILMLKKNSFSSFEIFIIRRGIKFKIPVSLIKFIENMLALFSYQHRKKMANLFFRGFYYIVAKK